MTLVSVIIPSFNTRDVLLRAIASVKQATRDVPIEIVAIDNGSIDGSADSIAARFPDVVLIRNPENLGFARAVNQGLEASKGGYYLLLNSDTESSSPFIDELVRFAEAESDVGIVAPRLLNSDGTDQGTARAFPTPAAYFFGRRSPLTRLWPRNPLSARYLIGRNRPDAAPFDVDSVSAACLLARATAVRQVGPLDERFFMYWEDTDWCHRFRLAGWRVCCLPSLAVTHHEGTSSRPHRRRLILQFHRSFYRYYCKHNIHGRRWLAILLAVALGVRATGLVLVDVVRSGLARITPAILESIRPTGSRYPRPAK